MSTMLASTCADQASILDEYPPYEWYGTGSCAQWSSDYVVCPADYAYKVKAKPTKEVGSLLTIALQKGPAVWRITGWAWAKH